MPLFSTIAHTPSPGIGIRARRKVAVGAVAAAIAGTALLASQIDGAADRDGESVPSVSAVAQPGFIEINTTGFPAPVARVASVDVDHFLHWNTDAFNGLTGPIQIGLASGDEVSTSFIEINTDALEGLTAPYAEPVSGPR